MKLHYSALLIPAVLALSACSEDSVNDGTTESFENLLASIEYEDANLQTCVEDAIESQGVNKTSDLQYFSCTKKLDSLAGLENFTELRGIDMVKSDLSCANLDKLDKELFANATTLGDDTPAVVTQPDSCFYNYLEFADDAFRTCVVEQFAVNGWTSLEDVTNLACDSLNIVSMGGVEQFPNLADFDISKTAINCDNTASFATANEAILVTAPEVCIIENVVLNASDDVAACIAAGAADLEFVVELKELTCSEPEFKDTKGLELLSSLTSLVLTDTSVDCYANRDFAKGLSPDINYAPPATCIMTEDTLFKDVIRSSGNPDDPLFADPKLQACFDAQGWSKLGDVTNLLCSSSDYQGIASFKGLEEFIFLEEFFPNKHAASVSDLVYLGNLDKLTRLNLQYTTSLKDFGNEVVEFIAANMQQVTYLNLSGHKNIDFSLLSSLSNLAELNASGNTIASDADIQAIASLTSLKTVTLANNRSYTSLLPFINGDEVTIETIGLNHKFYPDNLCPEIAQLEAKGITVDTHDTLTCE